jgi:glycosyltransferase involved in cell wall biosynthesis
MQQKFNDLYPQHAHKTEVVYSGKPLDKYKPVHRDFGFNLGMLCAIHPVKRIYEVVLMLYELRRQEYRFHLHLGGGQLHGGTLDEYYVAIQHIVEKLSLQDDVTFHGHVTDVPTWLQGIDVFISNSYWEGQQLALIEAMATGCYCLAHSWDGAAEVVPPENLYVTENDLMRKIIVHCNLPDAEKSDRRAEMRAIACEKFDIERMKRQIRGIINQVGAISG